MSDQYKVEQIPISEIFLDDAFNCRGAISPLDVSDLAQSIEARGLDIPISVQPASDVKEGIPSIYKWRIVAGHRRFTAYKVLATRNPKFKIVPAFVRDNMSEIDARVLNLSENLDRKELNILQEAKAMEALYHAGLAREKAAAMLKKSAGWVQVRYMLLSLPADIQTEAAAGFLNQVQIRELYSLKTIEDQYALVRKIKEAKLKGDKIEKVTPPQKVKPATEKRKQDNDAIFRMMEIIAKTLGYNLTTRFGAWATGAISSAEFFQDIKMNAEASGKSFYPPNEF